MALLEVCAADLASVQAAIDGGADRIELCTGLSADGFTPSAGMIEAATQLALNKLQVNVLIRPDEDPGFRLSGTTLQAALHDISVCAAHGCSGVVVGALDNNRRIDTDALRRMVDAARVHGLSVTFHRAFDRLADPFEGLAQLIEIGVDRVLTSGTAPTAYEGRETLRQLVAQAAGRIIVMPGAGINPYNAAEIVSYTSCTEIHSSCRTPRAISSDAGVVSTIKQAINSL